MSVMKIGLLALLCAVAGIIAAFACPPGAFAGNGKNPGVEAVRVGDVDIAHREYGEGHSGIPIALLMGYGCTMDIWPPRMLEELATQWRVIVFDSRGMGLSSDDGKDFSIEDLADDTVAFLRKIGVQRAHLLGWSMGGFIAQEAALRHPENVASLILCATSCNGRAAIDENTWRSLTDTSGTIEERIARMFGLLFPASWLREHPDRSSYFPPFTEPVKDVSIVRQARAMSRWTGACDRLRGVGQPTLAITGTHDAVIPSRNAFILAERIAGASVIQLKGGGHGALYQQPAKLGRLVSEFLKDEQTGG